MQINITEFLFIKLRVDMESMLKSMLNISAILVLWQVPHGSVCISLDGTQETPEK